MSDAFARMRAAGKVSDAVPPPDVRDDVEPLQRLHHLLDRVREYVDTRRNGLTEDITREFFEHLAESTDLPTYREVREAFGARFVNQRIGRTIKEYSGLESGEHVLATGPAAQFIRGFTKLRKV